MAAKGKSELSALVCPATAEHPRQSEASLVALGGGRLLLAYSDFYGGVWRDEGPARVCGKWSKDQGRTWSQAFVLQENIGRLNTMSASLLHLASGRVLLAFGRKDGQEGVAGGPAVLDGMVKWSDDEGASWSEPVRISQGARYYCMTNDRLVQLADGRVLYPMDAPGVGCHVWISEDEGRSWRMSRENILPPPGVEYAEPVVVQLKGGALAMYIRTTAGNIHMALSDDGERWRAHKNHKPDMCGHKDAGPNAAYSPCLVKRAPETGDLLLVWNNNRVRTPLTAAVSSDEGESWRHLRNLEEMDGWPPRLTHAYPSITFLNGQAHLTYWETHEQPGVERFVHLKYRRLPVGWFYERP